MLARGVVLKVAGGEACLPLEHGKDGARHIFQERLTPPAPVIAGGAHPGTSTRCAGRAQTALVLLDRCAEATKKRLESGHFARKSALCAFHAVNCPNRTHYCCTTTLEPYRKHASHVLQLPASLPGTTMGFAAASHAPALFRLCSSPILPYSRLDSPHTSSSILISGGADTSASTSSDFPSAAKWGVLMCLSRAVWLAYLGC